MKHSVYRYPLTHVRVLFHGLLCFISILVCIVCVRARVSDSGIECSQPVCVCACACACLCVCVSRHDERGSDQLPGADAHDR